MHVSFLPPLFNFKPHGTNYILPCLPNCCPSDLKLMVFFFFFFFNVLCVKAELKGVRVPVEIMAKLVPEHAEEAGSMARFVILSAVNLIFFSLGL